MEHVLADLFPTTEIPWQVIVARMFGAIVFGAVIGLEREYRSRPAGLRTHILVCLAAAVFAILSVESVHMAAFAGDQVQIDPLRVIEAVTSGVAFLAAGMIVFSRGEVKGLTTGAGMWLSGSVGLAIGLGYWFIGVFATLICVAILYFLGRFETGVLENGAADAGVPEREDRP